MWYHLYVTSKTIFLKNVEHIENTKLISKRWGGGTLGANDFLKVVVQLLDPSQVSASFTMDSKNKKTGKHHYSASVFNSCENVDASLKEVQEAEGRFSDPALLTD